MPDESDAVSAALVLTFGQTVADRVTYRAEVLRAVTAGQSVGSAHTAAPGSAVIYVSGCNCCLGTSPCPQSVCIQCANGYAPATYTLFFDSPVIFANGVTWGYFIVGGIFYVPWPIMGAPGGWMPGDCNWEGKVYNNDGRTIFFRLYYDSGWKVYVDYYVGTELDPYPGPSGNQVVYSIAGFVCCPPPTSRDPYYADPTGGATMGLTLISGSPLSGPTTLRLGSCGCGVVTVGCCAEPIPRFLSVSLPGSTEPLDVAGLGYDGTLTWRGSGYNRAGIGIYWFILSCLAGPTWHLKIYRYAPGVPGSTLVYDHDASAAVCYPILLTFPQAGFDFDGIYAGQTFTISVHV